MSGFTCRWSFLNWLRSNNNHNAEEQDREEQSQQLAVRQREQTLEQLHNAYQEVVGLMQSIQGHMAAQSDRSERLLDMMQGLPEALKTLPESQRNQARMLEAIEGHLAQQSQNSEGLTHAIQGLAQAADNHERAMNVIQQQLDTNQQSSQQVLGSFDSLSQTLGRMTESSQAGTQVLERLADRQEQADTQMRELFTRNQRQMTVMSVVSWSLAVAALTVASIVAIWFGRQITTTVTAAPPTAQAVAPAATTDAAVTPLTERWRPDEARDVLANHFPGIATR